MPNTPVDAVFVFEFPNNKIFHYRVKEYMLPPGSSLLSAIGFEFIMPTEVTKGRAVGIILRAERLSHIAYYNDFDPGQITECKDAVSVVIHHR